MLGLGLHSRARWALHRLRHGSGPAGAILLYHRIGATSPDPWRLTVDPAHFAEHLDVLGRTAEPVPLARLAAVCRTGRSARPAVAVTFDDGYAESLLSAERVLARRGVPATTFVASGYLGAARELWWDELERALLGPRHLPSRLALQIAGRRRSWTFTTGAPRSAPRLRALKSLHGALRPLDPSHRDSLAAEVRDWAGVSSSPRPDRRPVSAEELAALAQRGVLEIGAHTETHPVLAALSLERQRREVVDSQRRLSEIVGRPVVQFAYPHGGRRDYTAATKTVVRDAGFETACSAVNGAVWPGADALELPRLSVCDWDGETFARILRRLA